MLPVWQSRRVHDASVLHNKFKQRSLWALFCVDAIRRALNPASAPPSFWASFKSSQAHFDAGQGDGSVSPIGRATSETTFTGFSLLATFRSHLPVRLKFLVGSDRRRSSLTLVEPWPANCARPWSVLHWRQDVFNQQC